MMSATQSIVPAVSVLAGGRDYFQVPLALAERDLLSTLVTDSYAPVDRFPSLESDWLKKRGWDASKRFVSGLSSRLVTTDARASWWSLYGRISRNFPEANRRKDQALSLRALKETLRRNAILFAYSYYAGPAFVELARLNQPRLLFQVHPHPGYLRDLFTEELERVPSARASLMFEHEMGPWDRNMESLCQEASLATGIVGASSFTATSLKAKGVSAEHIRVVPYGVDFTHYPVRTSAPLSEGPLKLVFVGSLIQRKGLSYLLEALKTLGPRGAHLTCCTRGFMDDALLREYALPNVEIRRNPPRSEVVKLMWESDLLVLPSLAEGFAHVIAEAMATGLPVLTTNHTAGPDLFQDRRHGFIVPIRDAAAISKILEEFLKRREELFEMGREGAAMIRKFDWPHFRSGIASFFEEFSA